MSYVSDHLRHVATVEDQFGRSVRLAVYARMSASSGEHVVRNLDVEAAERVAAGYAARGYKSVHVSMDVCG